MTALTNRLKAATMGFGVTVAPLCIIAVTQLTFMPQIVGTFEGLDSSEQALAVSYLRRDWLTFHAAAAILVAIYWLLTAVLGRGQLLWLRAANVTLALFVFAVAALVLYSAFFKWPDDLEIVCRALDISDTDAPPFGFDTPSSCGAFTYRAHAMILFGLLGLPILLLIMSLIVRIVSSRRARSAQG